MFNKFKRLWVGLLAVLFLTGCSLNPFASIDAKNDPQEFLNQSVERLSQIESAQYDFSMTLDSTASGQAMNVAMDANGGFVLTEETTKGAFDGSVTISAGEDGTITVEELLMRVLDNKFYLRVGDLSMGEGGSPLVEMFLGDYLDKWFVVDGDDPRLSEELDSFLAEEDVPDSTSTLEELDIKKLRDILTEHNPLRGVTYEGNERLDGTVTDIISFDSIDTDETIELYKALEAELDKQLDDTEVEMEASSTSEETYEEMRELLKKTTISGKFWIGRDDQLVRKAEMAQSYTDGDDVTNMTYTLVLSELNQDYAVEAPTDTQDLVTTIEEELSGFFGGFDEFDTSPVTLDGFSDSTDMGSSEYEQELQSLLNELGSMELDENTEWSDEDLEEFLRLMEESDLEGLDL